jgi:hypothetical protein
VLLTNVVPRSAPFQRTTEVLSNPVPITVIVKPCLPTDALLGDRKLKETVVAVPDTVNGQAFDSPPPGTGVNTVTSGELTTEISDAEIVVWIFRSLTNVVARSAPFQRMTETGRNPLPTTSSVNPVPPAVALLGESEVMPGRGFVGVTTNGSAFDVPPSDTPNALVGLNTVICDAPSDSNKVEGITAWT